MKRLILAHLVELEDGKAPTRFLICSKGVTQTAKGPYVFSEKSAQSVKQRYDMKAVKGFVDYGHASLQSYSPADPALSGAAAARYDLSIDGVGNCYAENVKWTPRANKMLEEGEYAYISPALDVADDGTVLSVINCALTNRPATYGAKSLVELTDLNTNEEPQEPHTMTVKTFGAIAAVLQLSEGSTDDAVVAAVATLNHDRSELLTLTDSKTPGEALGKLRAWKDGNAKLIELQAEVAKTTAAARAIEVDALITKAETEKKTVPAQREFLKTLELEQLKGFLGAAQPVVPSPAKEPGAGSKLPVTAAGVVMLSDEEKRAAKLCGISEKDYAEHKTAAVPYADRLHAAAS